MTNILRAGSRGVEVAVLQQRLVAAGYGVEVDHIYGPDTEVAVRAFQRARDLVVDGVAGPRTQAALVGDSTPRALRESDIEAAAAELGCDAAALHAVIEVESGASGFLPDGRVEILFERHVMWRRLEAAGINPAPWSARWPGIVNRTPGGYRGGAVEYVRLATASSIHTACALESTSWGRFQLMGFHWQVLGYASAQVMSDAMATGEAEQLRAFCRFVAGDADMAVALRARDWPAFARQYNGPAYARDLYDVRLAHAYARHVQGSGAAPAAGADAASVAPRARRARRTEPPTTDAGA